MVMFGTLCERIKVLNLSYSTAELNWTSKFTLEITGL